MKAFFSCLMLIALVASQTLGMNVGNIVVPEKIKKSFQKKYPKHSEADWDDLGNVFVVNFYDENNVLKEATFELDGTWKETITSFDEDELLPVMATFIEEKYGEDVEFFEIVFSEKPDGNFYYVSMEVASDDEDEDSVSYTLTFDEDGKFLKKD